jgi:putative transposase
MPSGLHRNQHNGDFHFITFSCDQRRPYLDSVKARNAFELSLENARLQYGFCVLGYVVMPEHVHLLLTEPRIKSLATAIQALKQSASRAMVGHPKPFWLTRYYDFNVCTEDRKVEKLRYMHRNPVARGLVESPVEWKWSSFRHHQTGESGAVEIESWWTQAARDGSVVPEPFLRRIREEAATGPDFPRPTLRDESA